MKLGRHLEALASLEDALANLDIQPTSAPKVPTTKTGSNRMSVKKKASLAKDIRAILAEVQATVKEQGGNGGNGETKERSKIPKLVENTSLPGAARCIDLERDERRGRHIIAKQDIKVIALCNNWHFL